MGSTIPELIRYLSTSTDLSFVDQLVARIRDLVEASEEEYPDQAPVSAESLRDFIAFVQSVPGIVYPALVLTPQGNIRAEWTKARNKHLGLDFSGDNDIRFVVFAPDPCKPHRTNRASGLTTSGSLLEKVTPYGVLDWLVEQGGNEA
jgi:hypothetical protein